MLRATTTTPAASGGLTLDQLLSLPSTAWIDRLPKTAAGTPDLRFDPVLGPLVKLSDTGALTLDLPAVEGSGLDSFLTVLKKYSAVVYIGAAALFVLALMRSRR